MTEGFAPVGVFSFPAPPFWVPPAFWAVLPNPVDAEFRFVGHRLSHLSGVRPRLFLDVVFRRR